MRYLRSSTTLHGTNCLAEWEFVQSLAYKEQTPEDAEFVRLVYTSRLRKYKHAEEHALTRRRLVKEFGLSDNPDVLFSFADALYAQFRWSDCYAITSRYDFYCFGWPTALIRWSRILGLVVVHTPTMPLHIACMHHLAHLHSKLFILAHELVDREPESATSWYAVGVWYLTQKKWSDARTYFRYVRISGTVTPKLIIHGQQNVFDGSALRASMDRLRAYICARRRT